MLHGHTRITLRNPISGNILKDIESENTFQPTVLQNYTQALGEDLHEIPSYNWEDLVGGLFLFRDAIPTSPTPFYMPATNVMVGNSAVGVSNATLPDELGSYTGGSASISGITQKYEFLTSQANGTIGCVCLTSKVGGQIGYGNASGRKTDIDFGLGQDGTIEGASNSVVVGNIQYTFTLSGTTLSIQKTKRSLTLGSVFRGFSTTVTKDLSSDVPSGKTLATGLSVFALNDGTIRIYSPMDLTITSGSNVYFFDYDPSDDSIAIDHFANSANKTIRGDIIALSFTPDGYCITYDTDRYLQVFNVANGTHVMDYTTEALLYYDRYGNYDMPLSDGLLFSTASLNAYIINYQNQTVKPVNSSAAYNYSVFLKKYPSLDALSYAPGNSPKMIKNPLYLATVNNLETPVTKTSAQTMAVEYILTEA